MAQKPAGCTVSDSKSELHPQEQLVSLVEQTIDGFLRTRVPTNITPV